MTSTFLGLEIGKRSILHQQTNLKVVGHNLSNVDTEGYSRQKVSPVAVDPLYEPAYNRANVKGQLGQGVETASIQRERDTFLDQRVYHSTARENFWILREKLLGQVEHVHQALQDVNLQVRFDRFWSAWQELSKNPAEPAVRESLIQETMLLSRGFQEQFDRFSQFRKELDLKVREYVVQINDILGSIADLNRAIVKSEALSDQPNDYKDRRDLLIENLSKLVEIEVSYDDKDEAMIFVGGRMLVQGGKVSPLSIANKDGDEGMSQIFLFGDTREFVPSLGDLGATVAVRDGTLVDQIRRLDTLAIHVSNSVNKLHQEGFDVRGRKGVEFFQNFPLAQDVQGLYDSNGDGQIDQALIYQISGSKFLSMDDVITEDGVLQLGAKSGELVTIAYQQTDRISDVLKKINASFADIDAYLDDLGRFSFRAKQGIRGSLSLSHLEDSGNLLTSIAGILANSGPQGAFDRQNPQSVQGFQNAYIQNRMDVSPKNHPSSWMQINPAILADVSKIVAAAGLDLDIVVGVEKPFGPGDGEIARKISNLRWADIPIEGQRNVNDFYLSMVSSVASQKSTSSMEAQKNNLVTQHLRDVRQSISGVNVDEEMSQMLAYQHAFRAAAQFISIVDELISVVINKLGVTK